MISLRSKKSALAAVAVSVFALIATSVPANAEVGISSQEIKLGTTVPQSGPAAPGYNKVAPAMKAYFDYINDNGGVNGRKIKLDIRNDRYITREAINQTNDLLLKSKVFALVGQLGTANHLAVSNTVRIGSRGVPSLFLNTGFSGFADPKKFRTSYMHFPTYVMEAKILGTYMKDNFGDKVQCLLVQNDEFGVDAAKGFTAVGVRFKETVKYVSGTQSASAAQQWIQKFQAAKCEVVVLFSVSSANAYALDAADSLGFKAQWMLGSVGADSTTIKLVLGGKDANKLLSGAIGATFLPDALDSNDEYVKVFKEIYQKYLPGQAFDNNALVGMNAGLLTVQALRAAGPNPTRRSLMSALDSKGSTFASAAFSSLNVSRTSHAGHTAYWFGKFNASGELIPVDSGRTLYTTDSGNGPITKVAAKRLPAPAKGIPTNS